MTTHGNNDNENTSLVDVMLALKENVFRTLNVADLGIVTKIDGDIVQCKFLTNNNVAINCIKLNNISVKLGDVVLITFTNTDFRVSLAQYKTNQEVITRSSQIYHDIRYGVIIGIIYTKSEVK